MSGPRSYSASLKGDFGNYVVVIKEGMVIRRAYVQSAISCDEMVEAMARIGAHICLHLSTSSVVVISNLQEQRRGTIKTQKDGCLAHSEESFSVTAKCVVCRARHTLCRGGEHATGSLVLKVQRVIRDIRQDSEDMLIQLEEGDNVPTEPCEQSSI